MSEQTVRDIEQISRVSKVPLNLLYKEIEIDAEIKALCFQSFPQASVSELNNCYYASKSARYNVSKLFEETYY